MISAVIFDLDGVLVDSEPVWEDVRRAVVAEHGGRWAPDAQQRLMGMNTAEWARYLSADLGVGQSPAEVAELVIGRMAERYAADLPMLPGAVAAVRAAAVRWPLGLASSSPRVLIDTVLAGAGIGDLFAVTVSADEVDRGKPAPDIYLTVADRLGVPAARCVAVEDSSNGLRSAVAAGMRVIAAPRPAHPPAQDALAGAAVVVRGLTELTPELIAPPD
ncbi:MAG TPA: HAD family phosphatase [Pseudonocardiaceae bacterium]|jgi:HAD superfamily hydrolase (TIGR01509 family)|nr:HAD family phosphatase [Pseudonocardiaceae bacterium]